MSISACVVLLCFHYTSADPNKKKPLITVLIASFQPKKWNQFSCNSTCGQIANLSTSIKSSLKLTNNPCPSILIVFANLLASKAKHHFLSERINWAQIYVILFCLEKVFDSLAVNTQYPKKLCYLSRRYTLKKSINST